MVNREREYQLGHRETLAREQQLPELTDVERRILKNFYLTFKFSQTDVILQQSLAESVVRQYPREELWDVFDDINDRVGAHATLPILPRDHSPNISDEELTEAERKVAIQRQFESEWDVHRTELAYRIRRVEAVDKGEELTFSESFMNGVSWKMLDKDIKFVAQARTGRFGSSKDPHESFIKTYVIDQKATGSDEFDAFFQSMRRYFSILEREGPDDYTRESRQFIRTKLGLLQHAWEAHHDGDFWEAKDTPAKNPTVQISQ